MGVFDDSELMEFQDLSKKILGMSRCMKYHMRTYRISHLNLLAMYEANTATSGNFGG